MADSNQAYSKWRTTRGAPEAAAVLESLGPDMDRSITSAGGQVSPLTRGMAKRIALDAMHSYNPAGGTQFRSWVQTQMQRLSRPIRSSRFGVRVPELRAREASRLKSTLADLEAESGFEPGDALVADHLGLSVDRVRQLRAAGTPEIVLDDVGSVAVRPGSRRARKEEESKLVHDMVYHSLGPRDQVILERGLGYGGRKPQSVAAVARSLGVSSAAVSQRAAKIRAMLQEAEGMADGI